MSANPTWLKTLLQLHDCIFAHLTCIWLTKLTSAVRLNYSTCKRSAVECMCIYIDLRLNWRESFRLVPICQQHLVIYCSQAPSAAVMCSEHTQIGTNCGNDWVRLQGIVGKIELLHHRAINFIDCPADDVLTKILLSQTTACMPVKLNSPQLFRHARVVNARDRL